jgi:hypothetical protein
MEQRSAEGAEKLKFLREAARVGIAALDRGEFKGLENIEDLHSYLDGLSENVISSTIEQNFMAEPKWRVRLVPKPGRGISVRPGNRYVLDSGCLLPLSPPLNRTCLPFRTASRRLFVP